MKAFLRVVVISPGASDFPEWDSLAFLRAGVPFPRLAMADRSPAVMPIALLLAAAAPPAALGPMGSEAAGMLPDVTACRNGCQWQGLRLTWDGVSGAIEAPGGTWSVRCTRDPISDLGACFLSQRGVSISWSKGRSSLYWGGDKAYPGTRRALRIGRDKPLSFGADESVSHRTAAALLARMEAAPNAVFQFTGWPDNAPRNVQLDLASFAAVRALFAEMAGRWESERAPG